MPLTINSAIIHPGYLGGNRWYSTVLTTRTTIAVTAVDILYLYPFYIPTPVLFSVIGIRITAGGAGSSCKAGIWANNPTIMRPSGAPLISDSTGIATTGTGEMSFAANTATLGPGWYWGGTKLTGTLPTGITIGPNDLLINWAFGVSTQVPFSSGIISMADAYTNAMPTISTGQSWTESTVSALALSFKVA